MGFKVTVAGLGLMGGSLAKALRGWREAVITGIDSDMAVIEKALADRTIDRYYRAGDMDPAEALNSDAVIIALPPRAALKFIEENGKYACASSVWTDIVGVKKDVMEYAGKYIPAGVDFIGGHPMAGLEKFGYAHSRGDLFQGCNYVLVPGENTGAASLALIEEMIFYIGAGRVTFSDAERHDAMIAYVSQMPHVLAPAIIDSPNYFESKGFEGGSFHDLTRVGTLDPRLWSELFLLNREPLSRVLRDLEESTARLRKLIEAGDEDRLIQALSAGCERKDERLRMTPRPVVKERREKPN